MKQQSKLDRETIRDLEARGYKVQSPKKEPRIIASFSLDPDVVQGFKKRCKKTGKSNSEVLNCLIREWNSKN
jgi:Fe-S oxidoreductase